MLIPEKLKNRNVIALLFLGVVLIVYGVKWVRDNGFFASPDSAPLINVSELRKEGKDGDAKEKSQERRNEISQPASATDPFGIEAKTSPAVSQGAEPGKTTSAGKPGSSVSGPSSGTNVPAVASNANVSLANQSELMRIQADIMLLKARVEKAKLQAELEKLETPAPAKVELTPEMLASLTPPPSTGGMKPTSPAPAPEPTARLIGVQGTTQKMTATVILPSGQELTVGVGDTLQGSSVRAIDRSGLRLANGKRIGWD